MTDDMQAIRDDIAYLKAMALGGQDGSRQGGWIMIAAGGAYGLASLVQWAALTGWGGLSTWASSAAWLAALVVFFAVLFATKARQRADGVRSTTPTLAWTGIGCGLFVIFAAISIATWRTGSVVLISFSPAIVLTLYGAAWTVAAIVSRKAWLWVTAMGSFAAALVSAWLVTDVAQWLFYALALFALALGPGVIMVTSAQPRMAPGE